MDDVDRRVQKEHEENNEKHDDEFIGGPPSTNLFRSIQLATSSMRDSHEVISSNYN